MFRPGVAAASAAIFASACLTLVTSCGDQSGPESGSGGGSAPGRSVVTSVTQIAGAGVLGNDRRPDESCAAEPAPPEPSAAPVRHSAGETRVPADPQRIVVLAGDQLDTLCALGLQSRIVGAALPDGASAQPSYLGTVIHDLPSVGSRTQPDVNGIRAARPDLILGSAALTPDLYAALSGIAPTVFTGAPGAEWQDNLRTVGAAVARPAAADALVTGFDDLATKAGAGNDAAHYQASVVQLTENALRIYGTGNFPGSVLVDVGVDRPASQRFTDRPYAEIGVTDDDLAGGVDLSAADGDAVYVSFTSPAARDRAAAVFGSDSWRKLSATRDNRVFAVNNEVWQTGEGIVAARGIVADLRWLNAPIN